MMTSSLWIVFWDSANPRWFLQPQQIEKHHHGLDLARGVKLEFSASGRDRS